MQEEGDSMKKCMIHLISDFILLPIVSILLSSSFKIHDIESVLALSVLLGYLIRTIYDDIKEYIYYRTIQKIYDGIDKEM